MAILFDREDDIENALRAQGITNDAFINSIMGAINKESRGRNISENLNYSGSSAKRLRGLFSKLRGLSDAEIDRLKKNPQEFANRVYGDRLGNKEEGDGWRFRGRGPLQLTGRANYAKASQELFGDDRLLRNPDLILEDDNVAAQTTAWFIKSNLGKKLNQDVSQEQANKLVARAINPGMPLLEKVAQGAALYGGREKFQGLYPAIPDPYALPVAPPASTDLTNWQEPGAFTLPSRPPEPQYATMEELLMDKALMNPLMARG